jgi:DNA polymerase-3 subunit gamma/tau
MLDLLDGLIGAMRNAADVRLALEVTLTRLARPESDLTVEALAQRIEALEDALRHGRPAPASVPACKPKRDANAPKAKPTATTLPEPGPVSQAQQGAAQPAAAAGPLDPRSVKRSWPAVIAEIRKKKPSRSHLFDSTEPEAVGEVLVVEFPRDRAFSMDMAREPETLALLKAAIERVLGVSPPMQFRLGRQGASSPAALPEEPAPAAHEQKGADTAAEAPALAPGPPAVEVDDVEARLMAELGATVVEEREIGDAGDGSPS